MNATEERTKPVRIGTNAAHIQLLMGVFSMAGTEEWPFRDAVRATWMRQPGVCKLSQQPLEGCTVYAAFVLGNDGHQDSGEDRDLVILDTFENMNEGKSRSWFHLAATKYPWATHIMKLDLDAFPHVPYILDNLGSHGKACKNVYGGMLVTPCGEGKPYWPPCGCGPPVNSDFLSYESGDPNCFSYAQGGMYFLSRQLAEGAAAPGGWWDNEVLSNCYPEDSVTGRAVMKYGREKKQCVSFVSWPRDKAGHHQPGPPARWSCRFHHPTPSPVSAKR
uniref:Hexosyltransferase n=1 Tax=Alexandrium catenella TaxID=2925 RepID=A0A7S1QFQ9_ALECA